MKHLIVLCLLILINSSCSSKKNHDEAIKIYDESMKIHDEVMPRMDDLFSLRQHLNQKIDSLRPDSATNIAVLGEMRGAIEELQRADEAMMDWMHNTEAVPGSAAESDHSGHSDHGGHQSSPTTEEEIIRIQKDQLASIKKIQTDTEEAIRKAKQLLGMK